MRKTKRFIGLLMTCFMLTCLCCFNPIPTYASSTTYYVSAYGSDSNNGLSTNKPFKTLTKAVSKANAGTTIYVMNGTYTYDAPIKLQKSGSANAQIKILNYKDAKPVIDFSKEAYSSSNRGFQITGSYYVISGLTIEKAGDNGIFISGSHNHIKHCLITQCGDTGLQMSKGASHNYIYYVTSTYNYDKSTDGENADGFAAKLSIGPGNVFEHCAALHNSDDGYDCYSSGNSVRFINCEASYNGNHSGNGQGFKVGGNYTADNHYLEGCVSIGNRARGYDQNNNTGHVTLVNCTGINNNVNFYFPTKPKSGTHSFTGCISKNGKNKDKVVGSIKNCSFNQ